MGPGPGCRGRATGRGGPAEGVGGAHPAPRWPVRCSPQAPTAFPGFGRHRGPCPDAEGARGCRTWEGKLELTFLFRAVSPAGTASLSPRAGEVRAGGYIVRQSYVVSQER